MIVQWKTVSPEEIVGQWQGMSLLVFHAAADLWRARVDGKLVRQAWHTASAAKVTIDDTIERVILKASPTARAVQGRLTPRPPTGIIHGMEALSGDTPQSA